MALVPQSWPALQTVNVDACAFTLKNLHRPHPLFPGSLVGWKVCLSLGVVYGMCNILALVPVHNAFVVARDGQLLHVTNATMRGTQLGC